VSWQHLSADVAQTFAELAGLDWYAQASLYVQHVQVYDVDACAFRRAAREARRRSKPCAYPGCAGHIGKWCRQFCDLHRGLRWRRLRATPRRTTPLSLEEKRARDARHAREYRARKRAAHG
jgi:hypothetical protein